METFIIISPWKQVAQSIQFRVFDIDYKIFKMEFLKLAIFFVAVGVLEAKITPGQCPNVSTKLDFDATPVIYYQL